MSKEGYPVFEKWLTILNWILDKVEKYPRSARFTIANRTGEIAIGVMEGIVEAIYSREKLYILRRINLYIEKLRVFFRISFMRRYISSSQYEFISSEIEDFGKMIGGWIRKWIEFCRSKDIL